jgi:hemerythrin
MIKWSDKYSVGISIIDEEHKKLFELINKANLVAKFGNNSNDVLAILDQMTEYVLNHFETEEHYMKEFHFPGFQPHRSEHIDFTNTTMDYKNRAVGGDYQITNEILEYLMQWLSNHIQVTDTKYIGCFKENGLK